MINTFAIDIIPENDSERLKALHRYQIVDTPPEEVFNNLAHLVAEVFETPIALVSLVDEQRVFFKGNVGMPGVRHVDRGMSLCSLAVLSPEPTIITNALEDPCLLSNPLVHGDFGLRFYAGAPLITADGYNIGTLCIVDKKTRTFTDDDQQKLVRFAKTVMHTIEARLIGLKQYEAQQQLNLTNKKLEELNKELQFVTNTIPQLAWTRDLDGTPLYLNHNWTVYTGFSLEEIKIKGMELVVHPDDREKIVDAWEEAKNSGEPYQQHYRLRRHDGMYRWFLGRGVALKDDMGRVIKWYGTSTDIDEHVNMTEKLEAMVGERTRDLESQKNLLDNILEHSPNGITVYKVIRDGSGALKDMQCILANGAAEQLTGITMEERLSKTVVELTPELKQSPLLKQAENTLVTGEPLVTEYYYERGRKWLELSVVRMDDEHLVNVFRDITFVKNARLQLEQHVAELERINAELEHFTYSASHDMKEPIRKIHIFLDRLKESMDGQITEQQHHYFNRMEHATHRMTTLIEDLLAYTKVNQKLAGTEEVDLNHVIAQVLKDLDLEVEEKNAKVEVANLLTLKGHQRQMQQVFHNLIGNSLKYCKDGVSPHIRISCTKVKGSELNGRAKHLNPDLHYYQVEVADNGVGFEDKDKERIFNVFQRLQNTAERGSGLGLSIVRRIMENHGGLVYAESTPGAGASFVLLFPESN